MNLAAAAASDSVRLQCNFSPFLKRTNSAPENLEKCFRNAAAQVSREADKEVHTSSRLVSGLTARQEKTAAD